VFSPNPSTTSKHEGGGRCGCSHEGRKRHVKEARALHAEKEEDISVGVAEYKDKMKGKHNWGVNGISHKLTLN